MTQALIDELSRTVGYDRLVTDPGQLMAYGYDATMGYRGDPGVVLLAGTETDVSQALKIALAHGVSCVPRGGATSLSAAVIPPSGSLVIDTNQMQRIKRFDIDRRRATVEPGVVTRDFRAYAAHRGLLYAPDPSSEATATIGGNVATNAGGPYAYKYGVTRDAVTELRVVTPATGTIELSRGRDDVVIDIIIGSEGTLGIVTEIGLQLRAMPTSRAVRAASFPNGPEALRTVAAIINQGVVPAKLEFLDDVTIESLERARPWGFPRHAGGLLLAELDGEKSEVAAATAQIDAILQTSGGDVATVSPDQAEQWWDARRGITASLALIRPAKIGEDICVPRSQLAPTFEKIKAAASTAEVIVAIFGHAADGTLHPNLLYDPADKAEAQRATNLLVDVAEAGLAAGGILSGEHGLGRVKRPFVKRAYDPNTLETMRRIKKAFDPDGLMNPGAMWPD